MTAGPSFWHEQRHLVLDKTRGFVSHAGYLDSTCDLNVLYLAEYVLHERPRLISLLQNVE